ncbi:MAG: hypothetical protein KGI06_06050 [Candidatus Micrarchaeota archaeon]|nr:hypothetical protein [Candidatus Micrarchaeota archaeon]
MTADGGSAFPTAPEGVWDGDREQQIGEHRGTPGMSLRDWFAGQVLAGLMADADLDLTWGLYAEKSYQMADAMLAERAK